MKLKCTHCNHIWDTRKDAMSKLCPYCKYSTYYHRPIIIRK